MQLGRLHAQPDLARLAVHLAHEAPLGPVRALVVEARVGRRDLHRAAVTVDLERRPPDPLDGGPPVRARGEDAHPVPEVAHPLAVAEEGGVRHGLEVVVHEAEGRADVEGPREARAIEILVQGRRSQRGGRSAVLVVEGVDIDADVGAEAVADVDGEHAGGFVGGGVDADGGGPVEVGEIGHGVVVEQTLFKDPGDRPFVPVEQGADEESVVALRVADLNPM